MKVAITLDLLKSDKCCCLDVMVSDNCWVVLKGDIFCCLVAKSDNYCCLGGIEE